MAGRIDGDDNEKKKGPNKIDLTLEKKDSSKASDDNKQVEEKPVLGNDDMDKKVSEVKEIKVKVPEDIKVSKATSGSSSDSNSIKIVAGIIVLLMIGAGVLLFLLNSESQNLKGSVNELPQTNSTQIVDDILAEDFSNSADQQAPETEQVEIDDNLDASTTVDNEPETDEIIVESPEDNQASQSEVNELPSSTPGENPESESIVIDTSSIIEPESQEVAEVETVDEPVSEDEVIQEYNLESSAEVTNELISQTDTTSENDFTVAEDDNQAMVMEEVTESEEIQGDTGPGLWISVMIASFISLFYARKNDTKLG